MSATNTPSALYGSSFGPRTPRTPTCTSLFFSDTADLSQSGLKESEGANSADDVVVGTDVGATFKNEADSSSTDSQTNIESASSSNSHPAHPLSSMICIYILRSVIWFSLPVAPITDTWSIFPWWIVVSDKHPLCTIW